MRLTTTSGRIAAGALLAFVLLFLTMQAQRALGSEPGDTFSDNLVWSLNWLLWAVAGIAAGAAAARAVVAGGERAPVVFVAGVIGLLTMAAIAFELVAPH